jgi:predicted  nucleic acid-binding Zn-ribbon protein
MTDTTLKVLREIRDEIKQTNERIGHLEKRQTETENRLATELVAVVGAVNSLREAILEDRQLRHQVKDHEARLRELERRSA